MSFQVTFGIETLYWKAPLSSIEFPRWRFQAFNNPQNSPRLCPEWVTNEYQMTISIVHSHLGLSSIMYRCRILHSGTVLHYRAFGSEGVPVRNQRDLPRWEFKGYTMCISELIRCVVCHNEIKIWATQRKRKRININRYFFKDGYNLEIWLN